MEDTESYNEKWGIIDQGIKEREQIQKWRRKRQQKYHGIRKLLQEFMMNFHMDTLFSFLHNFNLMVLIQMGVAGVTVYLMQRFNVMFDMNVALFVSPIVFPLAFSINTDFQRREKVLEDLAVFKSSGMVWFFCMREWKHDAGLDNEWLSEVHQKLKSMLFHLSEFLLTAKAEKRVVILRAMYEDFSDTNQLIERLRVSKLPANTAIISRAIHLLNMMCLSFERLRVIREYRSPRSIRSFNKFLIMALPILLSPYFVYLGYKCKNEWQPYCLGIIVAFVFSALQGVQDKLDDPFDGMGEDDIHLDTIDEWTFKNLEPTVKRSINIGRFKVKIEEQPNAAKKSTNKQKTDAHLHPPKTKKKGKSIFPRTYSIYNKKNKGAKHEIEPCYHKYAKMLEGLKGDSVCKRPLSQSISPQLTCEYDFPDSAALNETPKTSPDTEVKTDVPDEREDKYFQDSSSISSRKSNSRIPLIYVQNDDTSTIESGSDDKMSSFHSCVLCMKENQSDYDVANDSLTLSLSPSEELVDNENSLQNPCTLNGDDFFVIPSVSDLNLTGQKSSARPDVRLLFPEKDSPTLPHVQAGNSSIDKNYGSFKNDIPSNETPDAESSKVKIFFAT